MRISVEHVTRYRYEQEAAYSIQCLRVTPSDFDGQRTLSWSISSRPASRLMPSRDGFGNILHLMTITEPHREIEISLSGIVETTDRQGVVSGAPDTTPLRVFLRRTALTVSSPEIEDLARSIPQSDRIGLLHELSGRIRDRIDYVPDVTHVATTATEALIAGHGVCQDHAHVFIAACRTLEIPARYVTGYLLLESDDKAEAHHAWAEAWVEGLGWIGFDVANRLCPTDRYVRMAVGLDAHGATPIRGSRRGGGVEDLSVAVRVAEGMSQQ